MGRKPRLPPDDPREWLNRARNNLARAKDKDPDAYPEENCFDAQQAAEKSIKAIFVHRKLNFPFTHDLGQLLVLLTNQGIRVPKYISQATRLTRFAGQSRYPSLVRPVTVAEYRRAVRIAEKVFRWASRQVEK